MNKNKKRLSKLLIPMLALTAMNVNAMENTKTTRNNSVGKLKYNTSHYKEMEKFGEQRKKVLIENSNAVKEGRQGVIRYAGPALEQLKAAGYLIPEERYRKIINKYELNPKSNSAHGHTGSFVPCKKGKKWYGIKYDPNPITTGIETLNNNTHHNNDFAHENKFYEDVETLFNGKPWITRQYAKFHDDFGTYRVVDYVKGMTMKEYCEKLKNKPFKERFEAILDKGTQILNIVHDYEKKGKINTDIHYLNLMVTKDGIVKVVDHGKYRDLDGTEAHKNKIATQTFIRGITSLLYTLDIPDLIDCTNKIGGNSDWKTKRMYDGKTEAKAYIFDVLHEELKKLNGCIRLYTDEYKKKGSIFNNEYLPDSNYKYIDHEARRKLLYEIKYFIDDYKLLKILES